MTQTPKLVKQPKYKHHDKLRGMTKPLDMHIRPIGKDGRFLGWRGVFTLPS
jgi:hypothetical protein